MFAESSKNQRNQVIVKEALLRPLDISNSNEQIEIHTRSGYKVVVGQTVSGVDKVVISYKNAYDSDDKQVSSIEMVPVENSVSISTSTNLQIKARNVEIEAIENMKLKSGSVMTINGSLVKIN